MGASTWAAQVGNVQENSPAFHAGILPNDEILSYYGYGEYGKSIYGEEIESPGDIYSFTEEDMDEILNTNINLKFFFSSLWQYLYLVLVVVKVLLDCVQMR